MEKCDQQLTHEEAIDSKDLEIAQTTVHATLCEEHTSRDNMLTSVPAAWATC